MKNVTASSGKLQNEELKNAYRAWLKDLHDDKPEKLLSRLGKKKHSGGKSRRKLRMEHAQQHTAASSLKDVALKKSKLPALHVPVDKQVLHDAQRRRHQVLVDEANYSGVQYSHQPSWRPGLAFFQQLVHCVLQRGKNVADESGITSSELSEFPVRIAPILLRIPVRRGSRVGVALLYCQERNQDEYSAHGLEEHTDNSTSTLVCRVYSQQSIWREHRSALVEIISNPSAEIYAVRKCAGDFECRYNDLQILRSRQEVELAIDELWIDPATTKNDCRSDLIAVQKYVPFKGSNNASTFASVTSADPPTERKAWIARCASRKRDKHSSTVWIISGGDGTDSGGTSSTMVTRSSSANCQLIKCTIDQAWSEPRLLASMSMILLEKTLQVRFNELVVDLLQDSFGTWWLLQVKAFSLVSIHPISAMTVSSLPTSSLLSKTTQRGLSRTQSAPNQFEATPQWRKWRCAGRYCTSKHAKKRDPANQESVGGDENDDDANEPPGYLTKKVLRSCEFYDDFVRRQDVSLAGGFTEFHSALAFHLQHRLPKRDRSQLYEPQPLCSVCLREYHSLRQQWTQTVGISQVTATSGTTRKKWHPKSFNDHVDQMMLPPRKLPSLHHEYPASSSLSSSYSAPVIPTSTSKRKPEDSSSVTKTSTYMDELAAMEEMLSEYEPRPVLLKRSQTGKQEPSTVTATTAFTSQLSSSEALFPQWDGEDRIEAMWQNLSLKPLERQPTVPSFDTNDPLDVKNGYNSISLHQELEKANERNHQQVSPDLEKEKKKLTCTKFVAAHTIPVQHCHRVFEDEIYREQLASDAISALQSGKQNVCYVVDPQNRNSTNAFSNNQRPSEDEDELAEMALRSLYIDVKQAILTEEKMPEVQRLSWPTRPTVYHEASGCMTVKLGSA